MKDSYEIDERFSFLKVHEWLAISIVISLLFILTLLTTFYDSNYSENGDFRGNEMRTGFEVHIKGAVDNPGVYHLRSEIKMKELLAMAGVSEKADLRRFAIEKNIKKARIINVPLRAMMTIYLKGAVSVEEMITVPKGTKVEDLLNMIDFSPDADLEALKRKRRLKPNEKINVPFRKIPEKHLSIGVRGIIYLQAINSGSNPFA